MASSVPSSSVSFPDSSSPIVPHTLDLGAPPSSANSQQVRVVHGSVGILWDIENCPVPSDVRPEDVAGNVRMALRLLPVINGAVTLFAAYGDFNAFPRRLREGCQRTGVKLVDVPNGRKDAADKAILVDMFLFALDNPPPSSILLISGDVDFAPALHILGQRGYTIILAIPSGVGVSSALSNAGRFVWDWPSVARGEGIVPAKSFTVHVCDIGGAPPAHLALTTTADTQFEEESIIYRGLSNSECMIKGNINQMYCLDSSCNISRDVARSSHIEYSSNYISIPQVPGSRSQSIPCVLNEMPSRMAASNEQSELQDALWVQPGDVQGLKGQIVKLIESSGGSLPLVRLPSEYQKMFGRPLYVAEYGSCKLVDLLLKMRDALIIEGKGNRKFVTLRSPNDRIAKISNVFAGSSRRERKGKGLAQEVGVSLETNDPLYMCVQNTGCYSDESSDEDKGGAQDDRSLENSVGGVTSSVRTVTDSYLDKFKEELQELLVSYSCCILASSFEALYEQRYKKSLNYMGFGVNGLEELIEKVTDVAEICEEQETKRKFLIVRGFSGPRPF